MPEEHFGKIKEEYQEGDELHNEEEEDELHSEEEEDKQLREE